jgi:hypothetical protein
VGCGRVGLADALSLSGACAKVQAEGTRATAVVESAVDDMPAQNVAHPGSPIEFCSHCPSVFAELRPTGGADFLSRRYAREMRLA